MRNGEKKFTVDSRELMVRPKGMASGHHSSAGLANAKGSQVTRQNRWRLASGFTLLELMTVLTLILILATIATPAYRVAIVRAREPVAQSLASQNSAVCLHDIQ
jgi:prepilin-type N-terminal cleavage/methylation domain-containing protein